MPSRSERRCCWPPSGVAGLAFLNDDIGQTREEALAEMTRRWPQAHCVAAPEQTQAQARLIFPERWSTRERKPLRLVLFGTKFDVRVWETRLKIPVAHAVT